VYYTYTEILCRLDKQQGEPEALLLLLQQPQDRGPTPHHRQEHHLQKVQGLSPTKFFLYFTVKTVAASPNIYKNKFLFVFIA
jgi:hypothetical protein